MFSSLGVIRHASPIILSHFSSQVSMLRQTFGVIRHLFASTFGVVRQSLIVIRDFLENTPRLGAIRHANYNAATGAAMGVCLQ